MKLTSDSELADAFGISLDKLHELRKRQQWPHVRLGRFDIRFTESQIEQIVESCTVAARPSRKPAATGLTDRSVARLRRTATAFGRPGGSAATDGSPSPVLD